MEPKRKFFAERDVAIERLREFIRFNYMTGSEVARRIGAEETTVYSWLSGESRPRDAERIMAFLDSIPAEPGSGIAPTGYEYKPYPVTPKRPRPCPFCRQARGEIRKVRGAFQGIYPKCGATGRRRDSKDEALGAWNGRS